MKQYPSIEGRPPHGTPFYIFDKLDGSNVRAEWTRKRGFHKFGKRNGLLDPGYDVTPFLSEAPGLIVDKYADALAVVAKKQRWDKVTFFFEFYGPNSFAGWHEPEPHTVTLIDVAVDRKGFMEPKDFVKLFGHLDIPTLIHHGNFTQDMAMAVANGTLEGMTFEGVVCKGAWNKKQGKPAAYKWKSLAWFKRLRERCGTDETLFERLK